ncbi:MAG TPA: type III-A CRISPR-associated RAMP protein Csm5 [Candidatus Latescibacteria bacterium]|nr:type III-A CRISPR-associated RAMP protein Csm5 [Candidatus Latescibacterota bacterium]
MKQYTLTIEPVTPVHIGTGEKVGPLHWTISDGRYRVWHTDRWMMENPREGEKVLAMLERDPATFRLDKALQAAGARIPDSYAAYEGDVFPDVAQALGREADKGSPNREVFELYRQPVSGTPVIPGSSIKGALRTAWLYHLITAAPDGVQRLAEAVLRKVRERKTRDPDEDIDALLMGSNGRNPTFSVAKCLHVGDAALVAGSMQVILTDALSEKSDPRASWFKEWKIFMECIAPGSAVKGRLGIDDGLLRQGAQPHGWNSAQAALSLQTIWQAARATSGEILEIDAAYFRKADEAPVADYLINYLKKELANKPPQTTLTSLGMGSGWLRLALGRLVEKHVSREEWKTIRKEFLLAPDHTEMQYPKSRKVQLGEDEEGPFMSPLGWVWMTYEEVKR